MEVNSLFASCLDAQHLSPFITFGFLKVSKQNELLLQQHLLTFTGEGCHESMKQLRELGVA